MNETRISTLIKLLNIKQKDFANALNVSSGNVNDWISGRRNPGKTAKEKICSTFNVSKKWLDDGIGTPFISENIRKNTICELNHSASYSLSLDEEALIDVYRELSREKQKQLYRIATEMIVKEEQNNKSKLYSSQTIEDSSNIG